MQLKDLNIGDIVYYILIYRDKLLDYSILQIKSKFEEPDAKYLPLLISFNVIVGNPQVDIGAHMELDNWNSFGKYSWIYTTNEETFTCVLKSLNDVG
jgi:hypothetical protein